MVDDLVHKALVGMRAFLDTYPPVEAVRPGQRVVRAHGIYVPPDRQTSPGKPARRTRSRR